jgi:hypothetical protein
MEQQQINVDQLFAKIGFLIWANDNLAAKIRELETMLKAMEAENKKLQDKKVTPKVK